MNMGHLPKAIAIALCLIGAGAMNANAAPGGNGNGQGGGKKPPTESSNNLSYPAVFSGTGVTLPGTSGQWTLDGIFPSSKSYGCEKPEAVGTFTYPNTSCVSAVGVPLGYDACLAGPCAGYAVDAIYRQKSADNAWQAETVGPNAKPQFVDFVDWGDNLETVSWKTSSTIRVEVTPFALVDPLLGFQMWHVFGQGPDELWGVRGSGPDIANPYVYDSTYAIIHSPAARLNVSKLVDGSAACPTAGGASPPAVETTWTKGVLSGSWSGLYALRDIPYTAELNIGGKFVYGYNWQLQRDAVPTSVSKAGWWRLTFYTENNVVPLDDSIVFDDAAIPTTPPPGAEPYLPVQEVARVHGGSIISVASDTGPLYLPTIDADNNLTYIDVCIVEGKSGGKKPVK